MNFPTLPKTQRTYEHKIWPHKIKYQAFTAGQQSLLLQVADKDVPIKDRMDTMSQLFEQSVNAGVPFSKLPTCLVEKVFLLMRSLAVGEVMKLKYTCQHKMEENQICGQEITLPIKLDDADIKIPEGFKTDFELVDGYFIKMKIPTYGHVINFNEPKVDISRVLATLIECLYTEEESWPIEDYNEEGIESSVRESRKIKFEEFVDWISDNIDSVMLKEITDNFFNKLPHIHYKSVLKCPNCNTEHPIEFNSLEEIFI